MIEKLNKDFSKFEYEKKLLQQQKFQTVQIHHRLLIGPVVVNYKNIVI